MDKKKWVSPKLTILIKPDPGGNSILAGCKMNHGSNGPEGGYTAGCNITYCCPKPIIGYFENCDHMPPSPANPNCAENASDPWAVWTCWRCNTKVSS